MVNSEKYVQPAVTLTLMIVLTFILPEAPLDPWNLLSPKKVATMILALTFIQVAGSEMARVLGVRAGAILTGFVGGLISSTATTAALAKRSKTSDEKISIGTLTFLSTTAAMLFEAIVLLLTGTTELHFSLLLIFSGPILTTGLMIYRHPIKLVSRSISLESTKFRALPILKLAAFIVAILVLSKILQNLFGQGGLLLLTFLVSLFEIHGAVIANVQLHDAGSVSVNLLGGLLSLSIAASYLSKLFLIHTMGSKSLRVQVTKYSGLLFLSLFASWFVFALFHGA